MRNHPSLCWDHSSQAVFWYCKEIQPVHSEGDQPWGFFGRNDAKAETPVLWPPHVKSWLIGKDSDAGRDWGQEEKGRTEDEMAGWHHRLDGRESEWTPRVGDGQWGLACCNSWGHKQSNTTEQLNWLNWSTTVLLPENSMDRGAWWAMGSQRIGHNWATSTDYVSFKCTHVRVRGRWGKERERWREREYFCSGFMFSRSVTKVQGPVAAWPLGLIAIAAMHSRRREMVKRWLSLQKLPAVIFKPKWSHFP